MLFVLRGGVAPVCYTNNCERWVAYTGGCSSCFVLVITCAHLHHICLPSGSTETWKCSQADWIIFDLSRIISYILECLIKHWRCPWCWSILSLRDGSVSWFTSISGEVTVAGRSDIGTKWPSSSFIQTWNQHQDNQCSSLCLNLLHTKLQQTLSSSNLLSEISAVQLCYCPITNGDVLWAEVA